MREGLLDLVLIYGPAAPSPWSVGVRTGLFEVSPTWVSARIEILAKTRRRYLARGVNFPLSFWFQDNCAVSRHTPLNPRPILGHTFTHPPLLPSANLYSPSTPTKLYTRYLPLRPRPPTITSLRRRGTRPPSPAFSPTPRPRAED